ncbi:hypothetical protein Ciccas_004822, partial [Cichlidogyrus casuarinus]
MPSSTYDLIVKSLKKASQTSNSQQRRNYLLQVKEFIASSDKSYLDSFFEEIIAFKDDSDLDIKRCVVEFTQIACQMDSTVIKRSIECLANLYVSCFHFQSLPVPLLAAIIQAVTPIYRLALARLVKVGLIESGAVSGTGIEAETMASLSFDVFSMCYALKDEIARLFLPSVVEESTHGSMMTPPLLVLKQLCSTLPDSLRVHIVSLIKSVIILQSRRTQKSEIPPNEEDFFCLNGVPDLTESVVKTIFSNSTASCCRGKKPFFSIVRNKRLNEEAERLLTGLIDWTLHGTGGASASEKKPEELSFELVPISLPILEHLLDCLVDIACQRPQFFTKILQAFETLHVNLPPQFLEAQVNQLRRKMKSGLLHLLCHPVVVSDLKNRITILLTDLGATQNEVISALQTRRKESAQTPTQQDEKALFKFDEDEEEAQGEEDTEKQKLRTERKERDYKKALEAPATARLPPRWPEIDQMVGKLVPRLSKENVADLVLLSMVNLPGQMPAAFNSTYTPIAAAGTVAQVNHLARLLGTQLSVWASENGLKVQKQENEDDHTQLRRDLVMLAHIFECLPRQSSAARRHSALETNQNAAVISEQKPITSLNSSVHPDNSKFEDFQTQQLIGVPAHDPDFAKGELLDAIKDVKLLPTSVLREFSNECFMRILGTTYHGNKELLLPSELFCTSENASSVSSLMRHEVARLKLLTRLPSRDVYGVLIEHALSDRRQSLELISLLLMQEYQRYKGFQLDADEKQQLGSFNCYDSLLCSILVKLHSKPNLFAKLFMEVPLVTDKSLSLLRSFCYEEEQAREGLAVLRQLIETRPVPERQTMLQMLIQFSSHDRQLLRSIALKEIRSLIASSQKWRHEIFDLAVEQFESVLAIESPTLDVPAALEAVVTQNSVLFMGLIPSQPEVNLNTSVSFITSHSNLCSLMKVYVKSAAPVKRQLLKLIDGP